MREFVGTDLKMKLAARVARLEHDRVMPDDEFVRAGEAKVERTAAKSLEGVVEREITLFRRDVVGRQVRLGEGGENTRQQNCRAQALGRFPPPLQRFR